MKKGKRREFLLAIFSAGLLGAAIPVSADVVNGNFSGGNTGFSNGYTFDAVDPPNVGGHYTVDTTPFNFNSGGANFGDHTTGTGLMLIADGNLTSGVPVWSESVAVVPNTDYLFTFYSAPWGERNGSGVDPSPATLVTTANGVQIGSTLNLVSTDGTWSKFAGTFNSGALSNISLEITDSNTTFIGNDFAIDDISLVPEPNTLIIGLSGATCLLLRMRRIKI